MTTCEAHQPVANLVRVERLIKLAHLSVVEVGVAGRAEEGVPSARRQAEVQQ